VSVSLVDVVGLWEHNSLLPVVSDGLEANQLDGEALELGLSAWQPREWGASGELGELQAELVAALPWEDPVAIIHEAFLNWAVNPFPKCRELELRFLVALVQGQGEVFSMVESEGLGPGIPDEALSLVLRVEWLGDYCNLFAIFLDGVSLPERVLRSVLSSNHYHSTVQLIDVLNRGHALDWHWLWISLGGLSVGGLLSHGIGSSLLLSGFLSFSLHWLSWGKVLMLLLFLVMGFVSRLALGFLALEVVVVLGILGRRISLGGVVSVPRDVFSVALIHKLFFIGLNSDFSHAVFQASLGKRHSRAMFVH